MGRYNLWCGSFLQIKGEQFVNLEGDVHSNLKPAERGKELRLPAQQQGSFSFFFFFSGVFAEALWNRTCLRSLKLGKKK